ncbi:MAG: hypothetical protein JXA14_09635 [Anaerolineae bacterium]|nr:hypothetical protein [Anaerolineae bacterium]
MSDSRLNVGRVLRAGTQGFVVGCEVLQPDIPKFGTFVRAEGVAPGSAIYGLIYNVSLEDDLFARHFIGADTPEEVVRDQRVNRQVPIEVSVLAVGCGDGEAILHCLPPQPPVTLDWLTQCTDEEVQAFTSRLDYFQLILGARQVPTDELLVASVRNAAAARAEGEGEMFLIDAGRELARLLAGDPLRLEGVLRRLRAA